MKTKKPNAELICKQFEDTLAPRLQLSAIDRAVYYHLLRHSHFEGQTRLRFSNTWVARNLGLSKDTVRASLRRLIDHRVVRLLKRSKAGHVACIRMPRQVPSAIRRGQFAQSQQGRVACSSRSSNLEDIDFMRSPALRRAIHAREGGACFYCLRRVGSEIRCLDHVVPRAELGSNSYRNLVSACVECNSRKGQRPAGDFLRLLYREGRLTGAELLRSFRSLKHLAAGKLRPAL